MRLLICAGASGGGVYPALAVLQALKNEVVSVLWVGSQGGMEADLVERAKVPFASIPAAGVHGVGLRALPGNLSKLGRGFFAARALLQRFQPDVMFFTGGYVAVPVAFAGRNLPTVLFVPDIEPGLALKVLSQFADHIAVSTTDSRRYFPAGSQLTVTGYPVRSEVTGWDRRDALEALGLSEESKTLLVFGGSKGARSLNQALQGALPELLAEMQIVHISGHLDWPQVERASSSLPAELAVRYHPYPYLHAEMGAALAAADLVVSRAGASTLGEFPLYGLPAILVPYPHAWRYQKVNAQYLSATGAAVVVKDDDLPDQLISLILEIMRDDRRQSEMRSAMRTLAQPQAARAIGNILLAQVGQEES